MKKIITTLSLIAITVFGFSQSMELHYGGKNVSGDTITVPIVGGNPGSQVHHEIDINNTSSNAVNFLVQRVILNPPLDPGCDLYFCTGFLCYPPNPSIVYNEPGPGTALAASTNLTGANGVIPHFDVGVNCCETYVLYKVYNTLSPNDTVRVTMHYKCATGIDDVAKVGGSISNAFPNPANAFVSIKYSVNDYSQKGKIVFYDMLGKSVKEVILQDKQGNVKINVSDLNSGVYFYTFVVNEKAILTKKLVINSK